MAPNPTEPNEVPSGNSRLLRITLWIVTILVVALIVYLVIMYLKPEEEDVKNINATSEEQIINNLSFPTEVEQAIDQDRDRLIDAEEAAFGTNPEVSDSDNDGLNDYDEVKIYKTDPLKADSDGDGHNDGDEVADGFDPNGPGELLNINSALSNQ
ncbi:MAG: hypothetical protein V1838_02340 [Patescibacteria group bacterium]